jgi:molybdate transport system ATP-binding protein
MILPKGAVAPSSARNRPAGRARAMTREGPMARVSLDRGFPLTALVTNQACQELGLREGHRVTAPIKAPAVHLIPRG